MTQFSLRTLFIVITLLSLLFVPIGIYFQAPISFMCGWKNYPEAVRYISGPPNFVAITDEYYHVDYAKTEQEVKKYRYYEKFSVASYWLAQACIFLMILSYVSIIIICLITIAGFIWSLFFIF